ncbi:hypothetical protein DLH72_02440 [Candidatus Gracilibacteria bacterium]|nr:MAG: hypothetical protein DLH72_02440 [Candidatus Gracilibacteria bacterium]
MNKITKNIFFYIYFLISNILISIFCCTLYYYIFTRLISTDKYFLVFCFPLFLLGSILYFLLFGNKFKKIKEVYLHFLIFIIIFSLVFGLMSFFIFTFFMFNNI